MKLRIFYLVIVFFVAYFASASLHAQEGSSVKFCFYNVENLFDIYDDSISQDEEFLPKGDKRWTKARYYKKLDQIARTLTAIGEWELPGIVGLCEIENVNVLFDLCEHRLLKKSGYKIIHKDSPDRRGIDVAILYSPECFQPLYSKWIRISFPFDTNLLTRDILYVKGRIFQQDTLHIFVNHWPSRWGGIEPTTPKRLHLASVLRHYTDSIMHVVSNQNVLIAGDLNDTPGDSSVLKVLGAKTSIGIDRDALYNLMTISDMGKPGGTIKHKADWEIFDQIIVSGSLLDHSKGEMHVSDVVVFSPDYLLIEDERYFGKKPFRTYTGPSYLGGFSDHLPVCVQLNVGK